MKTKNNSLTLEQFKDKHYGKVGSVKRDKIEAGYENFKIGAMLAKSASDNYSADLANTAD